MTEKQFKMIDNRVDFHKCAYYHSKCAYYGYDECNEVQAQNCKKFVELKKKR